MVNRAGSPGRPRGPVRSIGARGRVTYSRSRKRPTTRNHTKVRWADGHPQFFRSIGQIAEGRSQRAGRRLGDAVPDDLVHAVKQHRPAQERGRQRAIEGAKEISQQSRPDPGARNVTARISRIKAADQVTASKDPLGRQRAITSLIGPVRAVTESWVKAGLSSRRRCRWCGGSSWTTPAFR
jgi:hypothetical protein